MFPSLRFVSYLRDFFDFGGRHLGPGWSPLREQKIADSCRDFFQRFLIGGGETGSIYGQSYRGMLVRYHI